MTKLVLDPEASRVRVRTFAEGLLSRLAHDLELACRELDGDAERTGPARGTASVVVPVAGIDVAGTLTRGRVDPSGLSASDREDCLGKMRKDVFQAREGAVVRVEATLEDGGARVRVVAPNGRAVERVVKVAVEAEGEGARVSGAFELSLKALGSAPVKGPMNAFRVKDAVEVLFDVVFREA